MAEPAPYQPGLPGEKRAKENTHLGSNGRERVEHAFPRQILPPNRLSGHRAEWTLHSKQQYPRRSRTTEHLQSPQITTASLMGERLSNPCKPHSHRRSYSAWSKGT